MDFNETRDDGVAVASVGPYADHLHLAPDNRASTSSICLQARCTSWRRYQQRQSTEGKWMTYSIWNQMWINLHLRHTQSVSVDVTSYLFCSQCRWAGLPQRDILRDNQTKFLDIFQIYTYIYTYHTTTATHLMALYQGWPRWAGTRRNIHSLTPWLCDYYTTSLIKLLHFLQYTAQNII